MSLSGLWQAWCNFWFAKQSPLPMAVFRIVFGILILICFLVQIQPFMLTFYGDNGIYPQSAIQTYYWLGRPHLDLLSLDYSNDAFVIAFFWLFITAAVGLTLGLCTRVCAVLVFLGLVSFHNHFPFNLNAGDAFMRYAAFYLIFSPCGDALSLDRVLTGKAFTPLEDKPIWPQRMLQLQLCIAYGATFLVKLTGAHWLDGNALYYATRLQDMARFSIPAITNNYTLLKFLTWMTLATEFSLFTLVWIREFRYCVLLLGVLLHLGIDLLINLPVFQWLFIAAYLSFVDAKDLEKITDKLSGPLRKPHS